MGKLFAALLARVRGAYELLVALVAAVRLVIDPNRLPDVFLIDRALMSRKAQARILARLASDAETARALRGRRRLPRFSLGELATLPPGTLGRAFADSMIARGLDPAAIPHRDHHDDASYVQAHLYETHDIWHTVTGFDTDVAGELGLQAFYSAQVDGDLPRILMIGGLVNDRLRGGADWRRRVDALTQGWLMGTRARPLFGLAWERLWATPLASLRAELGIEPAYVGGARESGAPVRVPLLAS